METTRTSPRAPSTPGRTTLLQVLKGSLDSLTDPPDSLDFHLESLDFLIKVLESPESLDFPIKASLRKRP